MWITTIILVSVQLCCAFDIPQKCLSDLKINNDRYILSDTYRVSESTYPTDAHYDVYGNLFFVETNQSNEGFTFNVNVVEYNTTEPQKVLGLPEGISYSIAIDKKLTKVFFGTGAGMYVYNYDTRTASSISNSSLKLDMIFVDKNSNKYIIEKVDGIEEFYLLDGDKKIRCHSLEALNEMAIDDHNNFYFIRDEQLFVLKSTHSTPQYVGDVNYQGMAQIAFHNNNIFIASRKLAYFHENDTGNIKVVDNSPSNVTAVAFDNSGHFILGVQGKILKYQKNDCYLRNSKVVDEYNYNN